LLILVLCLGIDSWEISNLVLSKTVIEKA